MGGGVLISKKKKNLFSSHIPKSGKVFQSPKSYFVGEPVLFFASFQVSKPNSEGGGGGETKLFHQNYVNISNPTL